MDTTQECANALNTYTGTDPAMLNMRAVLRQHHRSITDLFVVSYKDATGEEYRLWKMRIPSSPQGDWVWQERMPKSIEAGS